MRKRSRSKHSLHAIFVSLTVSIRLMCVQLDFYHDSMGTLQGSV